ncbi:3-dehydroquinate synthase [Iodidimonas gelatinilytica]|uniref:3-dehydroquinate synthase n=1 Tax=Iodidimonas gelatinilytica TaxID=1236966 RepID=A0A5A7N030_9PROT|nr:3-dehydroquinate synthase [Iodidimonas gelatinilytica]GER01014.1 3-dehydroquinate synthase [Iodidimonas gelatinilytica]
MTEQQQAQKITQVPVSLGARGYQIMIGEGLLADPMPYLADILPRPKLALVSDDVVAARYGPALMAALADGGVDVDLHVIPAGEGSKCFAELERLCAALLDFGIERSDLVMALGGGVVGDLTGFAASVLRRGVGVVQIPTTLLSQVDSSVGGKTGINMAQGKNLVGAFHQPRRVLIDLATLDSLPERERKAGYAEVVKYGLIDRPDFFTWLERKGAAVLKGDKQTQAYAVAESCRAKAAIVVADERESGARALLNLGHSFGHAIEAFAGYDGRVLHGEAVAIGCQMALDLSVVLELCPKADADRLRRHLAETGLPHRCTDLCTGLSADRMMDLMAQDKKMSAGVLTFVLSRGIGQAFLSRDVPSDVLRGFLAANLI